MKSTPNCFRDSDKIEYQPLYQTEHTVRTEKEVIHSTNFR